MTHGKTILALALAVLVSGCGLMTPAQQDAADADACRQQGGDYNACRDRLMEYRRVRAASQAGR